MSREHQGPWWGRYELEIGEAMKWQIGALRFWLGRNRSEWRLAHDWHDGDAVAWKHKRVADLPEGSEKTERFAVSETTNDVHMRPQSAARSVVVRPTSPFRVLPGQLARIFLSSPLWIEIGVGSEHAPTVLRELPTRQLSDTWFGATTRDGELSYALKTNARTDMAEMPRADYRLLTPVVIENRAHDPLLVERLSLPVPYLSIYGTEAGALWSEEVGMLRTKDGDMAELDVRDRVPAEAVGARKLTGPRQVLEKGHLFRAFGSLLGLD